MRKSPGECRADRTTGRESGCSVVRQNNEMRDEGNVCMAVVRPALVYGTETWSLRRHRNRNWRSPKCEFYDGCAEIRTGQENKLKTTGTTNVGKITTNVEERRFKWCGHVMRREEHYTT